MGQDAVLWGGAQGVNNWDNCSTLFTILEGVLDLLHLVDIWRKRKLDFCREQRDGLDVLFRQIEIQVNTLEAFHFS